MSTHPSFAKKPSPTAVPVQTCPSGCCTVSPHWRYCPQCGRALHPSEAEGLKIAKEALLKISLEDYRGNRPTSAIIAEVALREICPAKYTDHAGRCMHCQRPTRRWVTVGHVCERCA